MPCLEILTSRPRAVRPGAPLAALLVLVLPSCGGDRSAPASGTPAGDTPAEPTANRGDAGAPSALDLAGIAASLSERMALLPGERVLLLGEPGRFDPLANGLRTAVADAGAEYLGAMSVSDRPYAESHRTPFTLALAAADGNDRLDLLRTVDLAIMLPGAAVGQPVYSAVQDVLREGVGRTIHFHWQGAYSMDGLLMDPDAGIDHAYQRSLLETDYDALSGTQSLFEAAARSAEVQVTTPLGTDLRFRIGDRPVTRQDGDASSARVAEARNLIDREIELPAGALRVAPIEESVHGTIAFPPGAWDGRPVRGLVMRFEEGRLVEWTAEEGVDAVRAELAAAGPAGQAFREFALGFNPTLAIPDDRSWIPYYGYGAGVVRLSLGDNTELGGNVGGGYVRWNFFPDATVRVGGETWVEAGSLRVPGS